MNATTTGTAEYERTVSAAVGETRSKFSLAEALAQDIAPRRGRPAHGVTSTDRQLSEAREEIVEAGGEPRSVATLRNYRLTALWVKHPRSGAFRWVDGRCWSVHDEARQRGMSYSAFAALPEVNVELVREAARELAPFEPTGNIASVTFLPPVGPDEVILPGGVGAAPSVGTIPPPRPTPQPKPAPAPQPYVPKPRKGLNLCSALSAVHRSVERIGRAITDRGVPDDQRGKVQTELAWLSDAFARLEKQVANA